jgi:hypothetical protein
MNRTPIMSLKVDPDRVVSRNNLTYHFKGDLSKMVDLFKNLIENPLDLENLGENCRKYAVKNHNIKKQQNTSRYLSVI